MGGFNFYDQIVLSSAPAARRRFFQRFSIEENQVGTQIFAKIVMPKAAGMAWETIKGKKDS